MSWRVSDAPDAYMAQLMRAIVGFALPIDRLEGQWKFSQHKTDADHAGVQHGLEAAGMADVLDLMKS